VPGERGVLLCIAPDTSQAAITLDYATAAFEASPILRQLIANRTSEALELTNRITIEVRAANFRRLRGPTYIAVIADESGFWLNSETSSNPDIEILNAVRPGLATTNGPLFVISSPYARRGELWNLFSKHYGPAGDPLILVARGATRIFNPSLPQSVVDRAMERDPAAAAAEYMAEFRTDLEAFVSREIVKACVAKGVYERPPERGVSYAGFVDPSAGSADSFTLCIGHFIYDAQTVVVDAIREQKPPFDPDQTVAEFSALLKSYGIDRITGDRFAGIWPVTTFAKSGIQYEQNARPKSDLYVDLLPLINAKRIELLDNERLVNQLVGLERRVARSGKDSIDHAPGGHDDVANYVSACRMISSTASVGIPRSITQMRRALPYWCSMRSRKSRSVVLSAVLPAMTS
jgi:hypothetical protein